MALFGYQLACLCKTIRNGLCIFAAMTDQAKTCISRFEHLQDEICSGLEKLDGSGRFKEDLWDRPGGGGGRSRTISGGLIEKGGVGFSAVYGSLSEQAGKALGTGPGDFLATGVSIVLHPHNPWMPIIHMNVRYFEVEGGKWWFGGGIDLTPHYIDGPMARQFHEQLKSVCDRHPCADYGAFKRQADDYFYIPHRKETRGIGGIFYDRLSDPSFESTFAFTQAVGQSFVPIYSAQAETFREVGFGESELAWQKLRRGRYVEFNLVWDRGTKFGLETDGRTESILMSMPPLAAWEYNYAANPGSKEQLTQQQLIKGIDWLA